MAAPLDNHHTPAAAHLCNAIYCLRMRARETAFQRTRNRLAAACAAKPKTLKAKNTTNMKKTLITLLALGSIAMAVTTDDALKYTTGGSTVDLDTGYTANQTNYTLTLVLDADVLISSLAEKHLTNSWIAKMNVDRNNGNTYDLGVGLIHRGGNNDATKYDASIMATYPDASGNPVGKDLAMGPEGAYLSSIVTSAWGYNSIDKSNSVKYAVLSVTGTIGLNMSGYLTMFMDDNTTLEYSGTSNGYTFSGCADINSIEFNGGFVQKAYIFDSTVSATDIKSFHTVVVPEPATATLSLLALCGLTMRRRRK